MARFQVGIDLGTTNSALAYLDRQAKGAAKNRLTTFPVAQIVGPGDMGTLPLLPSFLYIPGPHDLPPGALSLPWNPKAADAVGTFARNAGGKIPGRLVSSAKSWLCHPGVDRTAPLLPWGAPPDAIKVSPLEASTKYLAHFVAAWNNTPGRAPEDKLEDQNITLTVPASFDDSARTLTAEAAKLAGLNHVTLLEEPQAAFYAWLGTHTPEEAGKLRPGMRCLVIDVGGGTSDFSLIRVGEEAGDLTFEREAVGEHLLLGGDNMDLALAKSVEAKLPGTRLDAGQFLTLVQACRAAKEVLLGDDPPAEYSVTVVGRGRSVVSGTVSVPITRADVETVLMDGFFPHCDFAAVPDRGHRGGLQEMGLPYVTDAAIPKHLATFLREHLPENVVVDAVLFNGGVFTPSRLRDRVIDVMRPWFARSGEWQPLTLTSPSLDLAVAWGAAYSGQLRATGGRRIGGGIPRSYYLELAGESPPNTVPVVCIVPRKMEEGEEVIIPAPAFDLTLGEPALFPIYSSTVRGEDSAGEILKLHRSQLLPLPPLFTVLRGGKRAGVKRVPVTLMSKCTEIGTLELYCVSTEGNRWKLEFNVRDSGLQTPSELPPPTDGEPTELFPEEKLVAAATAIHDCFNEGTLTPAELPKALESALDLPRAEWRTALCRRLWDDVADAAPGRMRSPAHLSRWYNLAGYILRPGTGDALDKYRVDSLWKVIHSAAAKPSRIQVAGDGGADYWILWRRVAGGLNTAIQQQLWAKLKPILLGKGKVPANELAEMWRAAASFERLDSRVRASLGEELLRETALLAKRGQPPANYLFWAMTRLGARKNLTGPLNTIVHPDTAERWLKILFTGEPEAGPSRKNWAFALSQIARRTGLRGVDVSDAIRADVAAKLRGVVEDEWAESVEEIRADSGEAARLFGENLPLGLKLAG